MPDTLNLKQRQALELATNWFHHSNKQIFKLAGYAGTGKTFTARHIADSLTNNVAYCAYTGKAANVMQRRGMPARTIHSTIYRYFIDEVNGRKFLNHELRDELEGNPELILIDEASMVGTDILGDLLSFGIPILAIGDPGQLPPVGDSYSDLLQDPDIVLDDIVRQEEGSGITQLATAVRKTGHIDTSIIHGCHDLCHLSQNHFFRYLPKILPKAGQILTARNATRNYINVQSRKILHRAEAVCNGEKLICRKNDNNTWMVGSMGPAMLVNGLTGFAQNVKKLPDKDDGIERFRGDFRPDYEPEHCFKDINLKKKKFEYAYAITCHAAQGSEWDYVVLYDDVWNDPQDPLFKRRWLYTAITRAREQLLYVK